MEPQLAIQTQNPSEVCEVERLCLSHKAMAMLPSSSFYFLLNPLGCG